MQKLLKQSSISLHFENTRGQRVDYKGTTNANPVNDVQTKYQFRPNEDIIFLKPKDDRTYGERWTTVWRLEGGGAKAIRKDAVKMSRPTVQLGGDITKESEAKCKSRLERGLRGAKGSGRRKRISSCSDPRVDETTSICIRFCAVDRGGIYRRVRRQRKCAGSREIFEAMQESGRLALNLARLEPEKAIRRPRPEALRKR